MALKQGELYRCPDPECGCEIAVTRGTRKVGAENNPRCCCGMKMRKREAIEVVTA